MPWILATAAVVFMFPALKAGLAMDDLVQRAVELQPGQLDPHIRATGVALESGTLSAVLSDLFGLGHHQASVALAKEYGLLPWWAKVDMKAALWRPLTAFTHWVEYRFYPNSPMLMHAQNIAWFAAVVWLAALAYRELTGSAWAAGLAGVFFLLDKNTYFPVMFVANRGFVVALCFGLLCLQAHHRWRQTGSRLAAALSLLALAASLLANEGGASTLAFLLAYALWLEKPASATVPDNTDRVEHNDAPRGAAQVRLRAILRRAAGPALSVVPAILVVAVWHLVYRGLGFGVVNVGAYIDPVLEPARFAAQVGWRSAALLAGQITGVAPDVAMALTPTWKALVFALGCGALVVFLVLTLPLLRKNPYARYWFTVMVLAAVPASTVVPLSKNLGFVAVGAFGLISCFVAGLADGEGWVPRWLGFRALAWTAAGLLVLAHGPIAALGRVAATQAAPQVFEALGRLGDIGDAPELGDRDVIVLNAPCQLALFASPFARQYRGQPVPRTLRSLLPGCTAFEVRRSDANTLVAQSSQPDIFSCGNLGPVHSAYAFNSTDRLMARQRFQKGERVSLEGLTVEVLETDGRGQPSRVAFHFTAALESLPARWLFFDWSSRSYRDFPLPPIGEHVRLAGPKPVRLPDLARQALRAQSGP